MMNPAIAALRFTGLADVTPVQNQPVMGILSVGGGHPAQQPLFHLQHIFSRCEPGAVTDPENMGIDRDGRGPESDVAHHISGFAPHAGSGFQRLLIVRNLPVMPIHQNMGHGHDIFGFIAIKADGFDMRYQGVFAEHHHIRRG